MSEWQKVRDIDNPLSPWETKFKDDFPELVTGKKPSYQDLDKVSRCLLKIDALK